MRGSSANTEIASCVIPGRDSSSVTTTGGTTKSPDISAWRRAVTSLPEWPPSRAAIELVSAPTTRDPREAPQDQAAGRVCLPLRAIFDRPACKPGYVTPLALFLRGCHHPSSPLPACEREPRP